MRDVWMKEGLSEANLETHENSLCQTSTHLGSLFTGHPTSSGLPRHRQGQASVGVSRITELLQFCRHIDRGVEQRFTKVVGRSPDPRRGTNSRLHLWPHSARSMKNFTKRIFTYKMTRVSFMLAKNLKRWKKFNESLFRIDFITDAFFIFQAWKASSKTRSQLSHGGDEHKSWRLTSAKAKLNLIRIKFLACSVISFIS
jgi:hypothetical protein